MTHAFVYPVFAANCHSSRSTFVTASSGRPVQLFTSSASSCPAQLNLPRMSIGETPEPTPSEVSGDKSEGAPAVDSVDDVLNTIPGFSGENSDGSTETEQEFSLDTLGEDDDLADVEVLEELQPPKSYLNAQIIAEARDKFRVHESDTGSPEYQIATLTKRIEYMTLHLKEHPKDYSSTRGLLKMVATRTRLLKYLRRQDQERFHNIIAGLNIRISQQLRRLGE